MKQIKGYREIKTWQDYEAAKLTYFTKTTGRKKFFEWLIDEYNSQKTDAEQNALLQLIIRDKLQETELADRLFRKKKYIDIRTDISDLFDRHTNPIKLDISDIPQVTQTTPPIEHISQDKEVDKVTQSNKYKNLLDTL
jgi:hypothetical protein